MQHTSVRTIVRSLACYVTLAFLCACQHAPTAAVPQAKATGAAIVESSGGHQVGSTGAALKEPIVVQVNDDKGTPLSGALVTFHGDGVTPDPAAMLTDSSGQATTTVTLGAIAGRYQLTASTPTASHPATATLVEIGLAYQERLGALLADKHCTRCHDPESSAERVSNYDNLAVKPHSFSDGSTLNKLSDADLFAIIQHGGPALSRSPLMPAYAGTLSASDVRALIAYTRSIADPPYQPAGTFYAHK